MLNIIENDIKNIIKNVNLGYFKKKKNFNIWIVWGNWPIFFNIIHKFI